LKYIYKKVIKEFTKRIAIMAIIFIPSFIAFIIIYILLYNNIITNSAEDIQYLNNIINIRAYILYANMALFLSCADIIIYIKSKKKLNITSLLDKVIIRILKVCFFLFLLIFSFCDSINKLLNPKEKVDVILILFYSITFLVASDRISSNICSLFDNIIDLKIKLKTDFNNSEM
jgi:hypothetical protein